MSSPTFQALRLQSIKCSKKTIFQHSLNRTCLTQILSPQFEAFIKPCSTWHRGPIRSSTKCIFDRPKACISCPTRGLASSETLRSGHNRWSKIKHDKAKVDSTRNKERSGLARDICLASKDYGPDPNLNPHLSKLIVNAKKAGFPKASIAAAIARGQGQSSSGAALEPVTIELLHSPTGAAAMVDILTDNKARSLQDIRDTLKHHGAAIAPVAYMFDRRGMLSFSGGRGPERITLEEEALMDTALDAGAIDIETFYDGDDSTMTATGRAVSGGVIYTEASDMAAVAEAMTKMMGIKPERRELVWAPREDTMVESAEGAGWKQLGELVETLEDDPTILGVYVNTR